MKKAATILSFIVFLSVMVLVYQNCGEQNLGSIGRTGTLALPSLPVPELPPNSPDIIAAATNDYITPKNSFNYGETVYVKALNFDQSLMGCQVIVGQSNGYCDNFPTNYIALNPSVNSQSTWVFTSGIWQTSLKAKDFHGMTLVWYLHDQTDQKVGNISLTAQSVAAATTTDIVVFASMDITGLTVRNELLVDAGNPPFYSQIKNGNGNMHICQYVVTNTDGSTNPTDPCASSTPTTSAAFWPKLPTTGANVVNSGNPTLMTYVNNPGTYHHTKVGNYIFDPATNKKTGPFWVNYRQ